MSKRKSDHRAAEVYFYAVLIIGTVFLLTLVGVLSKEVGRTFMFHHALLFGLFILGLAVLVMSGFLLSISQIFLNFRLLRNLNESSIKPTRLTQQVLQKLGLQEQVSLIEDDRRFCFTSGVISSKIFISSALTRGLTQGELRALLLHELYHLQNRDPLKILFCRILQKILFFLPIIKHLTFRYNACRELAADSFVIEKTDTEKHLITLFVKTFSGNQRDKVFKLTNLSASFDDGLNQRLAKLAGKQSPRNPPLFRPLLLSLFIFALLFFLPDFSARALHSPQGPMTSDVIHNIGS